jgi:hypothetical protein
VTGVRSGRRTAAAVTLTAMLLAAALSGCGGHGSDASPVGGGSSPAGSNASPAGSGVSQQTASQIEGAVNDAQSELDGIDQDFAGDDAAGN